MKSETAVTNGRESITAAFEHKRLLALRRLFCARRSPGARRQPL